MFWCLFLPRRTLCDAYHKEFESYLGPPGQGYFNFTAYEKFLNQFGSHVVTEVIYESRMYQHRFSQSEQNYNERNFAVRACVAFSFRWI